MNKHCYRLIFSKTLGFLIPVAENSTAQRKPGQTQGPSTGATPTEGRNWPLKALPLALLGLLPNAFADIVVAPNQQTSMTQSANGVPVIDIADPNSKGLSHNRFTEFNVNQPGVIFNNSMRDGVSQIGEQVQRNLSLTQQARAILTEVTGNGPSNLSGTLEVFGGKADLLIANTPPSKPVRPIVATPDTPNRVMTPLQPVKAVVDVPDAPKLVRPVETGTVETPPKPKAETPAVEVVEVPKTPAKDTNARHQTAATTGKELKNVLAKLNSHSKDIQAELKANPMTVNIRGADGNTKPFEVSDAKSLKALHGQEVVTGSRTELVNFKKGYGADSHTYIKVVEQPNGGFTYSFTSNKPAPLK